MTRPPRIVNYAALAGAMALALAFALPRLAAAQKIDVKLGLWEMTSIVQMGGVPPMDTSQMSPEQQAKMAAAMEATRKAMAKPHVMKECLTKEKLSQFTLPQNHPDSCKPTVVTDTSTEYAVKFACTEQGRNESGQWHFVALTPTSVKGSGQITMEQGGRKMTSSSDMTARWVSASCGNVK